MVALFVSCSSSPNEPLVIRQFHLKEVKAVDNDTQMVRGEQLYRLKGAVTLDERKGRLGQYFTVNWNASGATQVVMEYQQVSTGAKTLRMARDLSQGKSAGKVEFKITGDAYNQGGRVLAWRIRLLQGERILSEKRSYLWR